MISAILLAAGESRRMGEFKQLLMYAGRTFVECCADHLLASRVDELVVVTGHREADVRRALGERAVRFVHNADYRDGMSSSVKRGLAGVSPAATAVLVALVDQPQIDSSIINRVIAEYEKHAALIVIPTYHGRNGHPVLIDLQLRDQLLAFDASQGLRQVIHAQAADVLHIEVATDAVLTDFDYPEDYQRLALRKKS
ncbi:MAG: molybdenum cofactor cytidylyltransferase [Blastocatellia bacterium]